jgi:thiamine pyrophosphokinase
MKKVLILCNGHPPSEQLFREYCTNADYFIAADGGGNIALNLGASPDVVIGDLDSFDKNRDEEFEIIFKPDQETNDLEKALQLARKERATHVQVLGATGLRLDQTLKNLSVLKQFDAHFEELRFRDNFGETRLIEKDFSEEIPIGTTISLFPLSGKVTGISTSGLKYPLKKEALENGVRDGSSNEVTSNPVQITYKKGDLLLFVADLPEKL